MKDAFTHAFRFAYASSLTRYFLRKKFFIYHSHIFVILKKGGNIIITSAQLSLSPLKMVCIFLVCSFTFVTFKKVKYMPYSTNFIR